MFKELKNDLPASIVVFFVAVPLCLGLALASGAPLFAGIIAGMVGGVVVGIASGSPLGVSGPANGLTVIVLAGIEALDSWPAFLLAVVLAGVIQLLMGYAKAGFIAYFIPSSVINGMITGVGFLIILKQLPHALGYDKDLEGDLAFLQADGETTLSAITNAFNTITPGAALIATVSIAVMVLWDGVLGKRHKFFKLIPGPMLAIMLGIAMNMLSQAGVLNFNLTTEHLVQLPEATDLTEFFRQFTVPDFSAIGNIEIWKLAVVLAIVASLETLLSVEATDKLDPHKRVTPTNRELKAQGLGNIVSGLCGGLPITQVIARSSVNIAFGGKTQLSTILHGVWLFLSALTLAEWLNMTPLASLAAILMVVGYKLVNPKLFGQMYRLGSEQFVPFAATIIGILSTDLLQGICLGLLCSVFYTLQHSYRNAYYMKDSVTTEDGHEVHHIVLAEEVSFFNKASIIQMLNTIPHNSRLIIDCSHSKSIAYDVSEFIKNYRDNARLKNIFVETIAFIEPR